MLHLWPLCHDGTGWRVLLWDVRLMKKALFLMFLVMMVMQIVSATDYTGDSITAYWSMENTLEDGENAWDLTGVGSPAYTTGKIGSALDCDADKYAKQTGGMPLNVSAYTIEFWFGITGWESGYASPVSRWNSNANPIFFYWNDAASDTWSLYFGNGAGHNFETEVMAYNTNWHHYVITRSSAPSNKLYIDGVEVITNTNAQTVTDNPSLDFRLCQLQGDAIKTNGVIDEVYIYNGKVFNTSEVAAAYNSSNGLARASRLTRYPAAPSEPPSLTLSTSLASNINSTANPYRFNITGVAVNTTDLFNCTMRLNGTVNQTLLNVPLNYTYQNFTLTYGSEEVGKDVNITCQNHQVTGNVVRTNVFLDSVYPRNTLTPYVNNTQLFRGTDIYASFTVTCSDPNLFSCNSTLHRVNTTGGFNETLNSTTVTNISTTTYNITTIRALSTMPNGRYAIVVTSSDSHTAVHIPDYQWEKYQVTVNSKVYKGIRFNNNVLNLSTDQASVVDDFALIKRDDRYIFAFNFAPSAIGQDFTMYLGSRLNMVYLPNSGYTGHFVVGRHWVDFESDDVDNVRIDYLPAYGVYRVRFVPQRELVVFNSIGDLNIQQDIYYLNVTENTFGFRMFIFDEDTPTTALTGTAEVEFDYYAGNSPNATEYNAAFSGSNTYNFNITTNASTIRGDLYIVYKTDNGFTHRYIVSNTTFNTTAAQNFTIYNFNTTTGISDLKITTRYNSNYKYYPEVIAKLQRRYTSENVWRTVQMDESGDFGQLFFNIKEESVDYRLIFTDKNNNILKTTNSLKFVCTSGVCDLTILLDPYSATAAATGITYSYTYDPTTKVVSMSWQDASAGTNTVAIKARQDTVTGALYPCNQTQTGASGTMSCNLTGRQGVIEFTITANGDLEKTTLLEIQPAKLGSVIGNNEGAVWAVIIIVICLMFGLFSPVGAIISMMIGLIAIYLLGIFTPITITFLIIVTAIGIVIGIKVRS